MSVIKEFKEFAVKGNVIDLAIGVIIGASFGQIVSSLVADILMPPLGLLTSGIDFSTLQLVIQKKSVDAAGVILQPEVAIRYGHFLQISINFILVAASVFFLVRTINRFHTSQTNETVVVPEPVIPEPSAQEKLLMEIRDALKEKR